MGIHGCVDRVNERCDRMVHAKWKRRKEEDEKGRMNALQHHHALHHCADVQSLTWILCRSITAAESS
eukprot:CAMPEP_0119547766 /NCGR_PEP_ID=MMETSP1352-20130426/1817_1 /TAXON_ID=265584 /ORGANISM="Stauroneis constricta, Strain CCMP1120" /LENGTH=66 /DNA_ID=CAMNT_0007592787 /DNA_START=79 /DNA_END=276 /DNA_ORIENTATION=-